MKNSKISSFIKRQEKYHKMGIGGHFSSMLLYNLFLFDKLPNNEYLPPKQRVFTPQTTSIYPPNNEYLPPKQRVLKKYSTICKIRVYLDCSLKAKNETYRTDSGSGSWNAIA